MAGIILKMDLGKCYTWWLHRCRVLEYFSRQKPLGRDESHSFEHLNFWTFVNEKAHLNSKPSPESKAALVTLGRAIWEWQENSRDCRGAANDSDDQVITRRAQLQTLKIEQSSLLRMGTYVSVLPPRSTSRGQHSQANGAMQGSCEPCGFRCVPWSARQHMDKVTADTGRLFLLAYCRLSKIKKCSSLCGRGRERKKQNSFTAIKPTLWFV